MWTDFIVHVSGKDVHFGFVGVVDNAAHLWGHMSQNPYFGGVNGRFQAKRAKYKYKNKPSYYQNYCIDSNQVLHNDKDHQ